MKHYLLVIVVTCFLGCKKSVNKDLKLSDAISITHQNIKNSEEIFRVKLDKSNIDRNYSAKLGK